MLRLLEISQFALIDRLSIEFHEGLNLLTGETGSGKSIIVDALGLLLGEKGHAEMIRTGAERFVVTGCFEVSEDDRIRKQFEQSGLEFNEEELIVKREFTQNAKGRSFVNHQMVPLSFLKETAKYLVDIHGQNEQQTLYGGDSQLQFLDACSNLDDLPGEVRSLYEQLSEKVQQIQALGKNEQERLRTVDLLAFQTVEIEKAQLRSEDEDERLAAEHKLLANAERLYQLSSQAYSELYEAETSASAILKRAGRMLEELRRVDNRCDGLWEQLQSARISLEDVALSLREYSSRIEVNPQRLELVENRMAEIDRLKKKYGGTLQGIFSFYQKSKSELENLQSADETLATLEREKMILQEGYWKRALELSEKRQSAAKHLEKEVERELGQLAMGKTRFRISFAEARQSNRNAQSDSPPGTGRGIDEIEFLISPNPGEDLKPLIKIGSGGEISRVMLALKSVKSIDGRSKTLVFDEVDSGIGGQTADVVGQKLKKLSEHNQVICVTHLPQIASYADSHYHIEKRVEKGRTLTQVARLDGKERVREIARMISGERVTDSVLKHAAELLKMAAK